MTLSRLPLSYCTNVHPGVTLAEVERGLDDYTVPLKQNVGQLAAGLWLAEPVVRELLADTDQLARFADRLASRGLTCYTLNAFPYGNFHSERVKEQVYLPDWTSDERADYTIGCANVLAALLPEDSEGSISTVPLGFKLLDHPTDLPDRCSRQLLKTAQCLHELWQTTGRRIRLAIEPEPLCLLETTDEAIQFFERLRSFADARGERDLVDDYLGICYDVCHQAVEFEDVGQSIESLTTAGIRIQKVHITCALQLENPGERESARRELARFVEPRYLHQLVACSAEGELVRRPDLTQELALSPDGELRSAAMWRVHFHVPVDAETIGGLQTTRDELKAALDAVARLDYAPHLEVETYTWSVLPGGAASIGLVDGLTREMTATAELLHQIGAQVSA